MKFVISPQRYSVYLAQICPKSRHMFKININDNALFNIQQDDNQVVINGKVHQWDLLPIHSGSFHIILINKSFLIENVHFDQASGQLSFEINQKKFTARAEDELKQLLKQLGMGAESISKLNEIKAPMPGLILDIDVQEGQEVKKGDILLILEAMKMENAIKSPGDGTISKINITKGDSVEKNQQLIEFAP